MKSIIFSQDCTYKGESFLCGQELKRFKKEDLFNIWRLNEKGFIEPLNESEFLEIKNSFDKKKKHKEEEK